MYSRAYVILLLKLNILLLVHPVLSQVSLLEKAQSATDPDSIVYYYTSFLSAQESAVLVDSLALFYGIALYETDQIDAAKKVLLEIDDEDFELSELNLEQQKLLAYHLFDCHYYTYEYVKAVHYAQRLQKTILLMASPDTMDLSESSYLLGNAYRHMGHYDKAIDCYLDDIRYLTAVGTETALSYLEGSYQNLGLTYIQRGDKNMGLLYYQKSLALTKKKSRFCR